MGSRLISIVVPVYNETDSLDALVGEIREVAARNDLDFEIVFVDDGSRDSSWELIESLARADGRIGGLRFRRNCGKAAALMAGFKAARRDTVFMMDADLQDPPEEMPRLLARLDEGYDMVSGWKRIRHDPWHKVYPSRVFNKLIGWLTGVHLHDHVCGFKVMRGEVARRLRIYGELHRFIGVLSAAGGFSVAEIATLHRARTRGVGKYGFTRFFKGFLDLLTVLVLTRYRWRPQHVIGVAGLIMIAVSAATFLCPFVGPLVVSLCGGLAIIAVGLAAELVIAERPLTGLYEVVQRAGWCEGVDLNQG